MNSDYYFKCSRCHKKINYNLVDGDSLEVGVNGYYLLINCPHCEEMLKIHVSIDYVE